MTDQPTAWAYEQACRALRRHRAENALLREFVVDLAEGWVGNVQARAHDVLAAVRMESQ